MGSQAAAMADHLVNNAIMKLEGMAYDSLKQQTEVGKRTQGLKDDMAWLQLLLRDADQRRRREINAYIELWARQTREVAFDAEDLLDEYLHEGRLHCRSVLDLPSLLRWLRHSATGLFVRQSICTDIDSIKARLDQIMKKTVDNKVQLQISDPATATSVKRPQRYVDWDAPSGRNIGDMVVNKEKLDEIKGYLKNQETRPKTIVAELKKERPIVAIMGKSGVGKTTLASYVYESSEVRAMFHYIIWVRVPQKFRLVDVIADMVRQTTFPGVELDSEEKDAHDIGKLTSLKQRLFCNKLHPEKDVHEKGVHQKDAHEKGVQQKGVHQKDAHEKDVHGIRELTYSLTGRLSKKKYLIVLDNVRTPDELTLFLSVLPECEGSAVLITTEMKPCHVACGSPSTMDDTDTCCKLKKLCDHQVELEKLKKEEARKMFLVKLFGKSSVPKNVKNATHAKTIENLLDNSLPLSGTLLAGLLRTKKEEVWTDVINQLMQQRHKLEQQKQNQEKVQEKQRQELVEGLEQIKKMEIEEEQEVKQPAGPQQEVKKQGPEEEEAIEPAQLEGEKIPEQQQEKRLYRQMSLLDQILMLSFDDLPPQLKQCFLYFSAFKAEEPIDADKLIRLWVAEGIVRPTDGRTAEKHGRDHLRILISRCLVNLVNKDYSNNIISVSIHERVIAFARSEAREINFLQVHHSTSDLPGTAIRRLSVRNAFDPHTRLALTTPKLRSLLCECPEAPYAEDRPSCFRKAMEYLTGRVISLNIHHCKFLRVVDLQGMVHRSTLPYEIGWLIYLQYLGLARTGLEKLPGSIKNLHRLQTLDISSTKIKQVPKGLWKIKALRHVLAGQLKNGPTKDNVLHNLQTLHTVQCKDPKSLKKLINLRSLRLWGIDKKLCLEDCLGRMECLKSLELAAAATEKEKDVVKLPLSDVLTMFGLRSLQHLKLDGKVSTSTEEHGRYLLHKLTKLELKNTGMDEGHIKLIAKVPNLACVILGKGSYVKEVMEIPTDGFPQLKEIQINKLDNLTRWSAAGSAFKQLQRVSILDCEALAEIPSELKELEHLVLLAVHNSPNLVNFPKNKADFKKGENLSILREEQECIKADKVCPSS